MNRTVQLHTQLASMDTKEIEDALDAGLFGSTGKPMALRELQRRRDNDAKVEGVLETMKAKQLAASQFRQDTEKWQADHELTKRSVQAAESQAKYAKWAFYLSILAVAISALALFVAAAQGAAEGMG